MKIETREERNVKIETRGEKRENRNARGEKRENRNARGEKHEERKLKIKSALLGHSRQFQPLPMLRPFFKF